MRLVLACALVGSLFLLPFPVRGEHGAYNSWSRLAWCDRQSACLHEIGHALDQQAGWASQTPEFAEAVQMYVIYGIQAQEPLPVYILAMTYTAPDRQEPTKAELYANLYAISEGDPAKLPASLRPFFNWRTGAEYQTKQGNILWLTQRLPR